MINENGILGQLIKKYNLQAYKQSEITEIAFEALQTNDFSSKSDKGKLMVAAKNCERIRVNCLTIVAATAYGAHVACIAADLAVLPGILCHGAVVVYQVAASDNCNAEAENCEGGGLID